MNPIGVVAVSLLGLFAGSAIWVVSRARADDRPARMGPVCADSDCGASLGLAGWLPLFGFGTARRCSTCGAVQPVWRVLFEIAVAVYFGIAATRFGDEDRGHFAAVLIFSLPLLIVLLVDAWTRFIHTDVIAVGLIAGLIFALADGTVELLSAIFSAMGAVAVFGFFFVLAAVIYRNIRVVPFGLGDVYLAAMIGAMTRYPAVVQALFAGMLLAGVISIVLLVTRRVGRRDPIPYGPYLCFGALLILLA